VEIIVSALSGSFVAVVFHLGEFFDFRRQRRRFNKRR